MNIRFVLYVLGVLLFIEGGLMLLPAVPALLYGEHDLSYILCSSVIAAAVGGVFWLFNRRCSKEIGKREGFTIVGTVWIVYAFFGSLPFVLSGYIPSITDAFFEAMSGFTTTGSTILRDIEALPHGLLFWRALMHFTGGIGILVLSIAILPIFGIGSMTIYQAETSAVPVGGKFRPRIKSTAKQIFSIYLILTASCILLYLPEMNLFDAVCHAFSTTATGGFSTKNASIGAYSLYSQYVTIFFMLLGSTPFILFFYVWRREFEKVIQYDEFRFYLLIILVASTLICAGLLFDGYGVERSVHESIFNVVSIFSTTGYAVSDYMQWSPPLWFIILLIALIGGCAGSTSGGLKVVRLLVLLKTIPVQFKKIMHQNAVIHMKLNRQNIPGERIFRTFSFFMIFLSVFTTGILIFMICGLNFTSAVGVSVACVGNTGLGLDMVGPAGNFANIPAIGKWVCSFLMLSGRLELYSILILFSPAFWSKQ